MWQCICYVYDLTGANIKLCINKRNIFAYTSDLFHRFQIDIKGKREVLNSNKMNSCDDKHFLFIHIGRKNTEQNVIFDFELLLHLYFAKWLIINRMHCKKWASFSTKDSSQFQSAFSFHSCLKTIVKLNIHMSYATSHLTYNNFVAQFAVTS